MADRKPFEIRPCREDDLDQILSLEKGSFPDPYERETFMQILSVEPEGFFVAEEEGRVIGYVAAVSRKGEGLILSLAVDPERRRRGLGQSLMETTLRYLSSTARRVYLQTSVNNAAAIALYEALSFVTVKRLRRYYPNGDDAYLMTLDLKRR